LDFAPVLLTPTGSCERKEEECGVDGLLCDNNNKKGEKKSRMRQFKRNNRAPQEGLPVGDGPSWNFDAEFLCGAQIALMRFVVARLILQCVKLTRTALQLPSD
jgi:hypothetical protein